MAKRRQGFEETGLPPAPAELDGKAAPEPETVRWVARHIDAPNPKPANCPDPFAWTLLRMCRESPDFCVFFVEKLWSKLIPSRAQIDQSSDAGPIDGKATMELIERIQRMRDKAIEGAAPAGAGVVPDAFARWDPKVHGEVGPV